MKNLLIDIGNSFTHIAVAGKSRILHKFVLPTHEKFQKDLVLRKLGKYAAQVEGCAISSVVPDKDEIWKQFLIRSMYLKPEFVTYKSTLPIRIKVDNARTLGADRICNAAAGYQIYKGKQNVIVVDTGTATTFEVILKNGDFVGGIIAPGIETSAFALNSKTGKLPLLGRGQLKFPRRIIGRNTLEAIQSGLMFGASHSIEGMIRQIEMDYGYKFKVILTGGMAKQIYRKLTVKIKLENDLVLRGLNYILNYNK